MPRLGLVIAQFYDEIAEAIESEAKRRIRAREAELADAVHVQGVYDTPLAADRLARQDEIDAVTVLGAVITGDTDHDQVITHAAAQKVLEVSLDRDTPVTFGVSGPAMDLAQAEERIEYCADAVDAAIEMVLELPDE